MELELFIDKITAIFRCLLMTLVTLILLPFALLGTLVSGLLHGNWQRNRWGELGKANREMWKTLFEFLTL